MSQHSLKSSLLDVASWAVMASICGACGMAWGWSFWQGAALYGFAHVGTWLYTQTKG